MNRREEELWAQYPHMPKKLDELLSARMAKARRV
jgi:hypothetical protein